jgi:hypothetical protein
MVYNIPIAEVNLIIIMAGPILRNVLPTQVDVSLNEVPAYSGRNFFFF